MLSLCLVCRSSPASCWRCTISRTSKKRSPASSAFERDVPYGWLLQSMHAVGASMFFLAVYIHMFRGLYYGSYKAPREVLWILGCLIYVLMVATAFLGYTLPWGQMSFWGATVITNILGAIPFIGESIQVWIRGGGAIDQPTLNRFFSLHYLLPFVIAGVVVLHVWALHETGQNNPTGVEPKSKDDTVPFTPYATIKDSVRDVAVHGAVRGLRVLHAASVGALGQFHPGQPGADAGGNRAGMVPVAVLRDPARLRFQHRPDRFQDRRRVRDVRRRSACCSSCRGSTPRACARCAIARRRSNSSSSSCWSGIALGWCGGQNPGTVIVQGRSIPRDAELGGRRPDR